MPRFFLKKCQINYFDARAFQKVPNLRFSGIQTWQLATLFLSRTLACSLYREMKFASVHYIESGIWSKNSVLWKMFTISRCSLYRVFTISRVDCILPQRKWVKFSCRRVASKIVSRHNYVFFLFSFTVLKRGKGWQYFSIFTHTHPSTNLRGLKCARKITDWFTRTTLYVQYEPANFCLTSSGWPLQQW